MHTSCSTRGQKRALWDQFSPFSFPWGSRNQAQNARLVQQCLFTISLLTGPHSLLQFYFNNYY